MRIRSRYYKFSVFWEILLSDESFVLDQHKLAAASVCAPPPFTPPAVQAPSTETTFWPVATLPFGITRFGSAGLKIGYEARDRNHVINQDCGSHFCVIRLADDKLIMMRQLDDEHRTVFYIPENPALYVDDAKLSVMLDAYIGPAAKAFHEVPRHDHSLLEFHKTVIYGQRTVDLGKTAPQTIEGTLTDMIMKRNAPPAWEQVVHPPRYAPRQAPVRPLRRCSAG